MTRTGIDLVGLAGLAAAIEGVRRIYPPAAFIVGGLCLAGIAWVLSGGRE